MFHVSIFHCMPAKIVSSCGARLFFGLIATGEVNIPAIQTEYQSSTLEWQ